MQKTIIKYLLVSLFFLFCAGVLALSIRGVTGNPTHETMNHISWKDEGPLELSPERGRFALTFSIIEDNALEFSVPVARFATPDLGYHDGKYVSLFAPGVSYLVIPGYVIGKEFGLAQVGTYAVISMVALINVILLRAIAIRLGASSVAGTIASFIFLFATPAYTYAVSLYQHHVSTFLILLSLYLLLRFNNLLVLVFVWFLLAASISIDYPNIILMFPVGIYALTKFFSVQQKKEEYELKFKLLGIVTFVGVILPLVFFMRFNEASYGDPFQFSGTVSSVKAIDTSGKPTAPEETGTAPIESLIQPETQKKSAVAFFQSRNMLNGLASQFVNRDRGILWFTPVILFSLLGIAALYKKHAFITTILISIVGMTLALYTMWGDPYGGWAFGSRYLIPAYAIMGIFLAFAIDRYHKNLMFITFFIVVSLFSLSVNTLGAITSSRNPPKPEILALEALTGREEKYGFDRNYQMIENGISKSFVYQTYVQDYMTAKNYYVLICGLLGIVFIGLVTSAVLKKGKTL